MKYLVVSFILVVISFFGVLRPLEDFAAFAFSPVQGQVRILGLGLRDTFNFFLNISGIYSENQALKEEILDLEQKLIELKILEEERRALKDQFLEGDQKPDYFEEEALYILSTLTGVSQDLSGTMMYANSGHVHGVTKDSIVVYKNYLVGKVLKVEAYRSLIVFLYSPDVSVAVKNVDSLDQTEGVVRGDFGTSLKMERVLQSESLSKGDVLVSSGKEGVFPPGYIVGRVSEVYEVPAEPVKSARVEPMIGLEDLSVVFILTYPRN